MWSICKGAEIIFDNNQEVIVILPNSYMNENMDGLCGNFDGNSDNEFSFYGSVSSNILLFIYFNNILKFINNFFLFLQIKIKVKLLKLIFG